MTALRRFDQFDRSLDFPPYDGRPRTYIICSTPRCGSHFLGHLLHSTGRFGYPLEYFQPDNLVRWKERAGTAENSEVVNYLFRHRTSPNGLFGIKMHLDHLGWAWKHGLVASHFCNADVILIERRDCLAQAVSLARALQTESWISAEPPKRAARYDKRLIRRCLHRIADDNRHWRTLLALLGKPYLAVGYEDLCKRPVAELERVAEHLGLAFDSNALHPFSRTERQGDDASAEWREWMRREILEEADADLLGWARADALAAGLSTVPPRRTLGLIQRRARRALRLP